jgi:hypothetical protein
MYQFSRKTNSSFFGFDKIISKKHSSRMDERKKYPLLFENNLYQSCRWRFCPTTCTSLQWQEMHFYKENRPNILFIVVVRVSCYLIASFCFYDASLIVTREKKWGCPIH